MAGALKAVQRSDGFWNENLADPAHFGGPEVTGTGLFVYGMAWGVNKGILAGTDYLPTIQKAWKAIVDSAIFSDGSLGYVQGTGDSPGDNGSGVTNVTPSRHMVPDFDDYGLGCVLLAGSEVAILAESQTSLKQTHNLSISSSKLHKTFVNHLTLMGMPSGARGSLTIFDLTGKVVARGRIGRGVFDRMRRAGFAEKAYVVKLVY